MTASRSSRPLRRRLLLGVALVLAPLVAPVEPGLLPGSLDHLAGESRAQGQSSSIVSGRPGACNDGWGASGDTCRIEQPACPYSPYNDLRGDTRLMVASTNFAETGFPEFCEERVRLNEEPVLYLRCAGDPGDPDSSPLPHFAVMLETTADGPECWALQLRTCEVGTRVSIDWCQAASRRSWNCPGGAIPRNTFNSCYVLPTGVPDVAQVCGVGAPSMVLVSCAEYVGGDFVDPPNEVKCRSYGTGSRWEMDSLNNPYWCKFDASLLRVACHAAAPPAGECDLQEAACLKRASGTGGCDGIARTMLCRNLQTGYLAEAEPVLAVSDPQASDLLALAQTAARARQQGCEPCQALPFQPIPLHCPDDLDAEPVYNTLRRRQISTDQLDALDQEQGDPAVPCASPPVGNPTWLSTHFSGAAVVNSPVIVQVQGVPVDYRPIPHQSFDVLGEAMDWGLVRKSFALFPGLAGTPSDDLVRTYRHVQSDSYSDAQGLANQSLDCVVEGLPAFRLIVEEFWPDKDETAIRELFGPSSLAWWDALSDEFGNPDHAERRRRTEARGLPYWPDIADEDARNARNDSLKTKIDCNGEKGVVAWCRWIPARSGYFRLKVGGAWLVHAREDRVWKTARDLRQLRRRVMDPNLDRDRVRDTLSALGCGPGNTPAESCAWPASVLGLNDELTDILPTGPNEVLTPDVNSYVPERDPDFLYWLGGDHHRFGGLDLRVRFTESRSFVFGNMYTETQSFGIQVHEVRVSTVTPSR